MKTKNITISAIFMALGLVMHFLVPPIFGGVKPDFLLSMMFMCLIITDDIKEAILVGLCGGVMSALTTSFPGGQIPNMVEKILTILFCYYLLKALGKDLTTPKIIVLFALGTLVSGIVFLLLALFITDQMALFFPSLSVVLLAMVVNSIFGVVLMNVYKKIEKYIWREKWGLLENHFYRPHYFYILIDLKSSLVYSFLSSLAISSVLNKSTSFPLYKTPILSQR